MVGYAMLFFMAWITVECWLLHLKEDRRGVDTKD